jgi:tetratricopeptide (TPR) repeat protein
MSTLPANIRSPSACSTTPSYGRTTASCISGWAAASADSAALAQYEHAARLMPNFASVHLTLSGLYLGQKDFDSALAASDRAVALSPGVERGHWNRAASLIGKERYGEAIVALKKVIELSELDGSTC